MWSTLPMAPAFGRTDTFGFRNVDVCSAGTCSCLWAVAARHRCCNKMDENMLRWIRENLDCCSDVCRVNKMAHFKHLKCLLILRIFMSLQLHVFSWHLYHYHGRFGPLYIRNSFSWFYQILCMKPMIIPPHSAHDLVQSPRSCAIFFSLSTSQFVVGVSTLSVLLCAHV